MLTKPAKIIMIFLGVTVGPWAMAGDSIPVELGNTPSETGATKVLGGIFTNDGVVRNPGTGEAVVLPPLEENVPVEGGFVFWNLARDREDALGFRHFRYRQRFLSTGALADLLPEPYTADGIPFSGGSLNMHYRPGDELNFVSGAYFENPQVPTELNILTQMDAIARAWSALEMAGFELIDLDELDDTTLEELVGSTKLKLMSSGDGRTFSLIWQAPAILASGGSLMTVLNDGTQDLIHYWDPNPLCDPGSNNGTTAKADPQNSNIPIRTGLAVTPRVGPGLYPYEAHWPESLGAKVQIVGYEGNDEDDCATGKHYRVGQIVNALIGPYYGLSELRSTVGDAVWKTKLTMDVFDDLDWDGFDDNGTRANIVVDADCTPGNAAFVDVSTSSTGPLHSVVICPRESNQSQFHYSLYSYAASLDLVAHEWGHGVVFSGHDLERDTDEEQQLHEGWADIIGHSVEWRAEGATSGSPETEDWDYNEDSYPTNSRQVNYDDGAYSAGPPKVYPYSYHKDDDCDTDFPHYCGLRLAVAFWLAANGETDDDQFENVNPVCRRHPDDRTWADCDLEVTPLGDWDATRVFFRVVTYYANETHDWDDYAELAKQSALNFFGGFYPNCDEAEEEQDSVQDAFSAIGDPGPTPSNRYCNSGCCSS